MMAYFPFVKSLDISGVNSFWSFLRRPLKLLNQTNMIYYEGTKFWRRLLRYRENFKGLYYQPPPLNTESFIRIVESTIPKVAILSIPKMRL
jgi:hypothetical protein